MAGSVYDSAMFRDLFGDAETGKLFTDSAEIRAMLLVEGALAKVQGDLGLIPADSGDAIQRAGIEIAIDPAALAQETGRNGVVVPALLNALRQEMNAPEHAQYVHWGATSQDIIDTALVLRLRQVVAIYETRLQALIRALGALAAEHAELPMVARTYGQAATVTGFGAVIASWGAPLIRHLDRLAELSPRLLQVSLSGAAGTLSAMGAQGPDIRAALAGELKLGDPGAGWHSCRDTMGELSGWITLVAGSLGKIGEDLILMTQSGIGEVSLAQAGASSTMPQKTNPVLASLLVAIAQHCNALNGVMQGALIHRQQRDGAVWFSEWMCLPQLCLGHARALNIALELLDNITANAEQMARNIDDCGGLIYAEALSFKLARTMARPDAQAAVKELCETALKTCASLAELAAEKYPEVDFSDVFSASRQLGTAPQDAKEFAANAAGV